MFYCVTGPKSKDQKLTISKYQNTVHMVKTNLPDPKEEKWLELQLKIV
jgi:hypothetical protein